MEDLIAKAQILIEALPYIRAFYGKTLVIKYGGAAMVDEELKHAFAQDVVLLQYIGMRPVVVHGGGPQIDETMQRLGLTPLFVAGLRATDAATMDVVEMVLRGKITSEIVGLINHLGGRAVGLSGKDGGLLTARRLPPQKAAPDEVDTVDLGLVGEVETVHPEVITALDEDGFLPVVAPVAGDGAGGTLNINADQVAAKLAAALAAAKLVYLTDVDGVHDAGGRLLASLTRAEAERLIREGIIEGGMIPKVRYCLEAVDAGVAKAHIVDGRMRHAVLLEIFTDRGIGTEIRP